MTTGLTGLSVAQHPHVELAALYKKILSTLVKIPSNAPYRQNTEPIIRHRWSLVENVPIVEELEKKIGDGQIEEVIAQAKRELVLSRHMLKARAWEPLIEEAPTNQWKWPPT